ncbi:hypothetical protein VHUM_03367 [Vanrija humicola]|uniref:Fe2OG dioxygenase domain-containing protein n=1 Tax=Vanrija humicola TaxID=5417 RepID=A0A7D8V029_VANHU|nr:hypothetical protein VHUM_03367 [Vanrija humicola]
MTVAAKSASPPPSFPFPVLDLTDLDSPETAATFRAALLKATHEVGFFYLTGTGVSPALEERLLAAARSFFALPEAEKLEIENIKSPRFRGYTRLGNERTLGQVDWREQIDIWPEHEALSAEQLATQPPYARLIGPNLWPARLPELKDVVAEWQAILNAAAHKLLRAWALALGAEEDFFDKHFAEPTTRLKIVKYPGVEPGSSETLGVGPHKDGGCVTLLWVQPGAGGLQVETEQGWVDAINPSIPGLFVVNIGEMIEHATGGYLKATVHRVLAPVAPAERISVPIFFNPSMDATFPVLELPEELRGKTHAVRATDDKIHALYGNNLLKSRLRAHPDVAAIHHPDLVASGKY